MSDRDLKFLDEKNWTDISRGWIYEAAMPFVGQRPLDFFIPDKDDKYRGTIVGRNGEFNPGGEQQIVVRLKQRKVVVVSEDDINSRNDYLNVTVLSITSIEDHEKEKDWYLSAKDGTHPYFIFLPKQVTGKESFINITSVRSVHKNMLLNDKKDISEFMPIIDDRLSSYLRLGAYKQLEEDGEDAI